MSMLTASTLVLASKLDRAGITLVPREETPAAILVSHGTPFDVDVPNAASEVDRITDVAKLVELHLLNPSFDGAVEPLAEKLADVVRYHTKIAKNELAPRIDVLYQELRKLSPDIDGVMSFDKYVKRRDIPDLLKKDEFRKLLMADAVGDVSDTFPIPVLKNIELNDGWWTKVRRSVPAIWRDAYYADNQCWDWGDYDDEDFNSDGDLKEIDSWDARRMLFRDFGERGGVSFITSLKNKPWYAGFLIDLFFLCRYMIENVADVDMSLAQYVDSLHNLRSVVAIRLKQIYDLWSPSALSDEIVMEVISNGEGVLPKVLVNKGNWDKFIEHGGNEKLLFGAIAGGNSKFKSADISNPTFVLQSEESYQRLILNMTLLGSNNTRARTRLCIGTTVGKLINDLGQTNQVKLSKEDLVANLDEAVDKWVGSGPIDNHYKLATRIICEVFHPNELASDLALLMNSMSEVSRDGEYRDARELATAAAIRVVVKYVLKQFNIVKLEVPNYELDVVGA